MGGVKKWLPKWAYQMQSVGKHKFESKTLADRVCALSRKRKGHKMSTYKCEACGFWHMGSSNGWRKKQK